MIFVIAGSIPEYEDWCHSKGIHPYLGDATPLVIPAHKLNITWRQGDELVVTGKRNPQEPAFRYLLERRGMLSKTP